jgi:predicted transcriptional regulator
MLNVVDKSSVTKVCVDDFAIRKRYTYGTVMVDLETHRIIDIINSRETKQVEEWLRSYPNLQIISRDGAQTYSAASLKSHPKALQISDRFHLLKNLSDAVQKYMYRLFASRLVIPTVSLNPEMQALYNTRNRTEKICFAHKKRQEGYTVNDIALLLHSATTTIQRYLAIPENEIPKVKENSRERQHIQQMINKQATIDEARTLYKRGHAIDEILRLTGHATLTIKNYLKEDCSVNNGHYDRRMLCKLAPYEQDVIEMRAQGVTYNKIHEYICKKGYSGTIASLRVFMQKERTHLKSLSKNEKEPVEYIRRKCLCQLILQEQYEATIEKYPILGKIYSKLREFHRIVFSQQSVKLDTWIMETEQLQIEELNTYINGLKNDITAVKNGIEFKYNNGLAEGSVNKIKLTKRIMYGRNSFMLLKAKLLLNEYYYQIN